MKRLSQHEPKPTEWLIEGRVPAGTFVVVSGRPGAMKSLWTSWLAAEVSQHHAVLFSNQEDSEDETWKRLTFAGARERRIHLPTVRDFPGGFPVIPRDLDKLERKIKQMRLRLIVMDAAKQHFGVSMYNDQAIRQALTPLKQMLERTGCTVVFVDHLRKKVPKNAHVLEAFAGGGSGLTAAARWLYAFGPNPEDPDERILAPAKVNNGQSKTSVSYTVDYDDVVLARPGSKAYAQGKLTESTARLVLQAKHVKVSATQVVRYTGAGGGDDDGGNPTTRGVCVEWLIGTLMFGEKSGAEIKEEGKKAGFSWMTIRRASDQLGVVKTQTKKKGFGTGTQSTWALPPAHPALAVGTKMLAARALAAKKPKAGDGS
jgi:hypothetical protein